MSSSNNCNLVFTAWPSSNNFSYKPCLIVEKRQDYMYYFNFMFIIEATGKWKHWLVWVYNTILYSGWGKILIFWIWVKKNKHTKEICLLILAIFQRVNINYLRMSLGAFYSLLRLTTISIFVYLLSFIRISHAF